MSTFDEFEGRTPAQVAEATLLFSESELRLMCARGEIQHHRGARQKIVFYRDDVRALLRQFRRTPEKKPVELTAVPEIQEETNSPFQNTPRSRAAHKETDRRSA